jgi:hypothetical protein
MIWLVTDKASYQIVACNIHTKGDQYELWVERVNGSTVKITVSRNVDLINNIKRGIEHAIEIKDPIFRM